MRRTNRDRPPAVRPKLAFEPLEPRELLAADLGIDWWSTDPAADSAPNDDWVWAFDDGWNFGRDGGDPMGTEGWWVGDGAADPATDDVTATEAPDPAVITVEPPVTTPLEAEPPVPPADIPEAGIPDSENVTPMPAGEDVTITVVDTPAPLVDDVATPAADGAEPDSVVIDEPVVDDGTVLLHDLPIVEDETVINDGPVTDMPVIEDVPATDPFDDTGTVHDATGDATPPADPKDDPASLAPEPVAGLAPEASGPVSVPHVPKAADGEPAGPPATVVTGPVSAASPAGPMVVSPPAPALTGGRAAGAWGAFLGMFGLPANAAASPATGLQASGQDGTGKPRVRLPFRPIA